MSRVQPRTYELAEANAVLPDLEDQQRIAQYRRSRPDATEADRAERDRSGENLRQAELDLAGALTALEGLGIQLKDMRVGLVDFLSYRDDKLVELCWKLGEDRVAFWHRIGEGFAGRKPI